MTRKKKLFYVALIIFAVLFFLSLRPTPKNISFGVTFSSKFAKQMGLDWKETYLAVLNDMGAKNLRIPVYWDEVEKEEGKYFFEDTDWMINEAEKRGVKIILVLGRKLPRWPECFEPEWVQNQKSSLDFAQDKNIKNQKLLNYISEVIKKYKNSQAVWAWQVENEPFLPKFGECPKFDRKFLDEEIDLVKSLDTKPVIISDSGELSVWFEAARRADVLGTTMYRIVWDKRFGYIKYPIPAAYFRIKTNLVKLFTGIKKIIVVELQAEPWGPKMLYESSLEEQEKSMNFEQFRKNIEYARETKFSEYYLWGAEWWYWLKEKHNKPEIWDEAKKLFRN